MFTTVLEDLLIFFSILVLFLLAFGTTKSIMQESHKDKEFLDRIYGAVGSEWLIMFGEFGEGYE